MGPRPREKADRGERPRSGRNRGGPPRRARRALAGSARAGVARTPAAQGDAPRAVATDLVASIRTDRGRRGHDPAARCLARLGAFREPDLGAGTDVALAAARGCG